MKKLLYALLLILYSFISRAQTVSEKFLCNFKDVNEINVNNFRMDEKSGTYIFENTVYDSVKGLQYSILSNKGISISYDFINESNVLFDSKGNYYVIAERQISDSTYDNILLKNGKEIYRCELIDFSMVEKSGFIYALCIDANKSYILKYNITGNNFSKGKSYDKIFPIYFDNEKVLLPEREKLTFNRNGKLIYLAKNNNEAFIVIGDEEQKHYADIMEHNILMDKSDNLCYIAKDTGSFLKSESGFVIKGNKRYPQYNSVNNLILDKEQNLLYVANTTSSMDKPQVMLNDKPYSRIYNGRIYSLEMTPSGKICYQVDELNNTTKQYESFIVFDGKETEKYNANLSYKFTDNDELIYKVSSKNEINKLVTGEKVIEIDKSKYVSSFDILKDGRIVYIFNVRNGNLKIENDKYFISIDEKMLGPYSGINIADYTTGDYILSDSKGNYVYTVLNYQKSVKYSFVVYYNNMKSPDYDFLGQIYLYNGKPLYAAGRLTTSDINPYKYNIVYGDKKIAGEFDSINDFRLDEKNGIATCYASKENNIFKIEVKF